MISRACGNPDTHAVKSLLEAHALIEGHSPVWTPKMLIFKQIFQNVEPPIKAHPQILKRIGPTLC